MDGAAGSKRRWRELIREAFTLVGDASRRELDAVLAERVEEIVFQHRARRLLGFAPLSDEPDLSGFFRRWVAEGGELALPRWLGGSRLELRLVTDWDGQLRPGRAGILEPSADLPEAEPESVDLVLAPGRAFSEDCERLGRGAGCYDCLLRATRAATVGVAYDFQVFPGIAVDAGDVPLGMVVTPSRIVQRK